MGELLLSCVGRAPGPMCGDTATLLGGGAPWNFKLASMMNANCNLIRLFYIIPNASNRSFSSLILLQGIIRDSHRRRCVKWSGGIVRSSGFTMPVHAGSDCARDCDRGGGTRMSYHWSIGPGRMVSRQGSPVVVSTPTSTAGCPGPHHATVRRYHRREHRASKARLALALAQTWIRQPQK